MRRHGVVVGFSGIDIWVLTPARAVELMDFSARKIFSAKIWNGSDLPGSVPRTEAVLDVDSTMGVFKAEEIEAAIRQVAALPAGTARGHREALAGTTLRRRARGKTPPPGPVPLAAVVPPAAVATATDAPAVPAKVGTPVGGMACTPVGAAAVPQDLAAGPECVWLVTDSDGGAQHPFGSEVVLAPEGLVRGE